MTATEKIQEIRDWTEEMAERLLRHAGITTGMRVLDVGCAHGEEVDATMVDGVDRAGDVASHRRTRRRVRG